MGREELEQVLDVAAAREVAHKQLPRARPLPRQPAKVLAGVRAQVLPARRAVAARPLLLILRLVTEARLRIRPPTLLLLFHGFKKWWRWRYGTCPRPRTETSRPQPGARGSAGDEGGERRREPAEVRRSGEVEDGVAMIGGGGCGHGDGG